MPANSAGAYVGDMHDLVVYESRLYFDDGSLAVHTANLTVSTIPST